MTRRHTQEDGLQVEAMKVMVETHPVSVYGLQNVTDVLSTQRGTLNEVKCI